MQCYTYNLLKLLLYNFITLFYMLYVLKYGVKQRPVGIITVVGQTELKLVHGQQFKHVIP